MNQDKRVAVAVFIRNTQGEYLLMKRNKYASRLPGMWMVPGGVVEIGETMEAAARRECREEIGCQLVNVVIRDWLPDISSEFVLVLVDARLQDGEIPLQMEPEKHEAPQWLNRDEINELLDQDLMPGSQTHYFQRGYDVSQRNQ